jgi:hypothetical protein
MEQTISSFISKCQMVAQWRSYLIIAKKRVHSQLVYAHFSGVRAYTSIQCMRTERVDNKKLLEKLLILIQFIFRKIFPQQTCELHVRASIR